MALTAVQIQPALAGGRTRRPPQRPAQSEQAPQGNQESGPEIDTEDLFGFTVGSDVGKSGDIEGSLETVGRFGRRGGRYHVYSPTFEAQYTPTEGLSLALDASFDRYRIGNVPDLDNRHAAGLGELSMEWRYRLVKRDPSPVGLTISLEPQFGFFDQDSGERARRTAQEARVSLDAALVPERVFGAINLTYEAEHTRPRDFVGFDADLDEVDPSSPSAVAVVRTPAERESTIGVSGAMAFQAAPDLFVGAEVRYQRKYDGLDFRAFAGHALFAGPTVWVKFSDHVSLAAAWNVQVAGRAHDEPGHLDLENFERHQAKLKLVVQF
jgi:hypothetical protein